MVEPTAIEHGRCRAVLQHAALTASAADGGAVLEVTAVDPGAEAIEAATCPHNITYWLVLVPGGTS